MRSTRPSSPRLARLYSAVQRAVAAPTLFAALLAALLPCCLARPCAAQTACANATNGCFTANLIAPGCNNPDCCALVCTIEPTCCNIAWDDICVAIAEKYCSRCGTVDESCFQPHGVPSCRDGAVCEAVCAVPGFSYCCQSEWDEGCVAQALLLVDACGKPAAGSCVVVHENPNCADETCCEVVCTIDPRCCQTTWDEACVRWAERFCITCGNPRAGSCCHSHPGPFCDDANCCEAVCLADPFCCDTRWDISCADLASIGTLCNLPDCRCGEGGPEVSCRVVHETPGCSDRICCDDVCYLDSFCCAAEWDRMCVETARALCALTPDPAINSLCSSATGSCIVPHSGRGCSDAACCGAICVFDASCCDVVWDADCAARATILCNDCGQITAGSCYYPHGTPGCSDRDCCDEVCDIDPPCCIIEWDIFCVINAGTYCDDSTLYCGSPVLRPCAVPSPLPSCRDEECCAFICASLDPTCCSRAWDETCAANAIFACDSGSPRCPGTGNCLQPHGLRGCADPICCDAVCALDPLCCDLSWSAECVRIAKGICWTYGGCPGEGPCDSVHARPGCEDATCCTIVCQYDPVCCDINWSGTCVNAAVDLCLPNANWPCPCNGSCFIPHAENGGCEDEVCCAGVCNIDPTCCTEGWDEGCVSIARITCCGFPGCGDPCAGDCLTSNFTPFCDDASCCEAVCRFEPYCCEVRWDSSCAEEASIVCVGGCGLPVSGNCFTEHDLPGCSRGDCCQSVCASEEFAYCCTVRWDSDCADRARKLCEDELPECGRVGLPGCNIPHRGPACGDKDCCEAICNTDPFCCKEEWDATCVESIYIVAECSRYRPLCGGACAGSCCEPHRVPWCNDAACCNAVCALDDFCCTIEWDEFCAQQANLLPACSDACPDPRCGTPEAGGCCTPHDNANCNDATCCDAVCALDAFCCSNVWDATCSALANANCDVCGGGLSCGDPDAGSCCNEHEDTPYCSVASCCVLVCSFDESCCISGWDTVCVKLAQAFCDCD